jgi:hypothetical protein
MKSKSDNYKITGLSKEDEEWLNNNLTLNEVKPKESVSVNRSVKDTYKRQINKTLGSSKREAVEQLELCNYKTPPKYVSELLQRLFADYETKEGHWLYIAQHWNPRAINRVIKLMTKQHRRGETTILNPAAYFTYLIKRRKQRRNLTSTNDTRKQNL